MPWQPIRITGDLLARWEFEDRGKWPFCRLLAQRLPARSVQRRVARSRARRQGPALRRGWSGSIRTPAPFFHPGGVTVSLWCKPSEGEQSDRWMLNTVGRGSRDGYRLGLGDGHPVWQVPRERNGATV